MTRGMSTEYVVTGGIGKTLQAVETPISECINVKEERTKNKALQGCDVPLRNPALALTRGRNITICPRVPLHPTFTTTVMIQAILQVSSMRTYSCYED